MRLLLAVAILMAPLSAIADPMPHLVMWRWSLCEKPTAPPDLVISTCVAMLKAAKGNTGNTADYLFQMGHAYNRKNQPELATRHFDIAIRISDQELSLHPEDSWWLNQRCWMSAVEKKALEAALTDCNKALTILPDKPEVLDSRAFVFYQMGKYQDALDGYSSALRAKSDSASSLLMRSATKAKLGDTTGARADLAAAKAINSDIEEIYAGYGIKP